MGSALLETTSATPTASTVPADNAGAEDLRRQVAERLAAHRSRRGQTGASSSAPANSQQPRNTRTAQIAAAVAERYSQSQSYRAFLAAEAERAVQQARAAAEVAALNAQAVAQAQLQLLEALDTTAEPPAAAAAPVHAEQRPQPRPAPAPRIEEPVLWPETEQASLEDLEVTPAQAAAPAPASFTVRLYEDAASAVHVALKSQPVPLHDNRRIERDEYEAYALDEEIAFRHSPVFEEVAPPEPIPGNLIEFPRRLVAPRKARPRYAEGPLRDEAVAEPGTAQLRIFEVEPAQISTLPEPVEDSNITAPQWSSICLDGPAARIAGAQDPESERWENGVAEHYGRAADPAHVPSHLTDVASVPRRMVAAAVNGAIIAAAAAVFASTAAFASGHSLPSLSDFSLHALIGQITGHAAPQAGLQPLTELGILAVTAACFYLLYQALFFTFNEATPGMRAARIALCTFDDENPRRPAMRRRIFSILLSGCPLGLGFLWAALDEDRLSWHDRVSRIYQRTY